MSAYKSPRSPARKSTGPEAGSSSTSSSSSTTAPPRAPRAPRAPRVLRTRLRTSIAAAFFVSALAFFLAPGTISQHARGFISNLGSRIGISGARMASESPSVGTSKIAPVICISHGGGPLPLLNDPDHASLIHSLRNRVPKVLSLDTSPPRAIVLVTAHWQTRRPAISSAAKHSLYYDYQGFPPQTYNLSYPAAGAPEIAKEISDALAKEGMVSDMDDSRGWDHGVFVPMLLIRPQADIPIVQISVLNSEDPEEHTRLGRALLGLRKQNIAVVGSGFASFHNLRLMFRLRAGDPAFSSRVRDHSKEWNSALVDALKESNPEKRAKNIAKWRTFPYADEMHPPRGGEHFMPLVVCSGAAGEGEPTKMYADDYLGVGIYSFYWGAD